MKCEQFQESLAAYLEGSLGEPATAQVREHLQSCEACRAQADALALLHQRLLQDGASARRPLAGQGGKDAVLDKTLAAVEAAGRPRQALTLRQRIGAMKALSKLAVAAMLLITAGGIFLWAILSTTGLAFADVLKEVRSIQAVRYRMVYTKEKDEPDLAAENRSGEMLVAGPSRMRFTSLQGLIMISDMRLGKFLVLDPKAKLAMPNEFVNVPKTVGQTNFLEAICKLPANAGKPIGQRQIGGIAAEGFDVVVGNDTQRVWVSKETRLPVLVEVEGSGQGVGPTVHYTLGDFVWNPPVDEAALSLTPPEGYRVAPVIKHDASLPKEADIAGGLKAFAELNGGEYPAELNMEGLSQVSHDLIDRILNDKEAMAKGLRESMEVYEPGKGAIIRMLVYMDLPQNGSDWHYAGGGVKAGQAERPILWYRPAGSANYRMINGDLSVHEVAAADLPRIPSTLVVHPVKRATTRPQAATATNVVAGLKAFAELNGGVYPDGIDAGAFEQMTRDHLKRLTPEPPADPSPEELRQGTPEQRRQKMREYLRQSKEFSKASEEFLQKTQEFQEKMVPHQKTIGTMWAAMDRPENGSDWHYAGGGVKAGEADRPIFWYRPVGAAGYRVINGDLSMHEVTSADLPRIPSKVVVHPSQMAGAATRPE